MLLSFFDSFSIWSLLISLLISISLALVQYRKQTNKSWKFKLLLGIKSIILFILILILCNPLLLQLKAKKIKPTIAFAIDNSKSIPQRISLDSIAKIVKILDASTKSLAEKGYNVVVHSLSTLDSSSKDTQSLLFDHTQTDLNNAIQYLTQLYESDDLSGIVLVSDGVHNAGISPIYQKYSTPIYSVGIGDTSSIIDASILEVNYNKYVYSESMFPIEVEIKSNGFSNKIGNIALFSNGKKVSEKKVDFSSSGFNSVLFNTTSAKSGVNKYQVILEEVPGEFTLNNNNTSFFVNVIDDKKKVLILANHPHPDIKAIKQSLEKKKSLDVDIKTLYIGEILNKKEIAKFDLIILHDLPGFETTNSQARISKSLENYKGAKWFILGRGTNLKDFSTFNSLLNVSNAYYNYPLESYPIFEPSFKRFSFDTNPNEILELFPPLQIPTGTFSLALNADILFYQKFGNAEKKLPLMALSSFSNSKEAIWLGEGMWQWKMQEFLKNKNSDFFDELVNKTVLYLTSKENKSKLRVEPVKDVFLNNNSIVFDVSTYDDLYKEIFDQKISLKVQNSTGKVYSYDFINYTNQFKITSLPEDTYRFIATSVINNKREKSTGGFSVQNIDFESINLQADHNLLRIVSNNSGGQFYSITDINSLEKYLSKNKPTENVYEEKELSTIIDFKILLFLIIVLAGIEWTLRKRSGLY